MPPFSAPSHSNLIAHRALRLTYCLFTKFYCSPFRRLLSRYPSPRHYLSPRPSQQREPSHNARPNLIILRLRMAITPKLRRLPQQAPSEPRSMSLPLVRDNLDLQTTRLRTTGARLRGLNARVDEVPDIALETTPKIFVESGPAGEDDILLFVNTLPPTSYPGGHTLYSPLLTSIGEL